VERLRHMVCNNWLTQDGELQMRCGRGAAAEGRQVGNTGDGNTTT
jgi:hypothetical protein